MGRWSNLVLLSGATGEILEARRFVPLGPHTPRPLERGGRYQLPPEQKKQNPGALTREALSEMIREADIDSTDQKEFARWLVRSVAGVSPVLARELALASGDGEGWAGAADALMGVIESYQNKEFAPAWILGADGEPMGLSAARIEGGDAAKYRAFGSMNEAADAFYGRLVRDSRLDERKNVVSRMLRRAGNRVRSSIEGVRRDLASAGEADAVLRKGELLLAHLDVVEAKASVVSVPAEDGPLEIALDPRFTPLGERAEVFPPLQEAQAARLDWIGSLTGNGRRGAIHRRAGLRPRNGGSGRGRLERGRSAGPVGLRRARRPEERERRAPEGQAGGAARNPTGGSSPPQAGRLSSARTRWATTRY